MNDKTKNRVIKAVVGICLSCAVAAYGGTYQTVENITVNQTQVTR